MKVSDELGALYRDYYGDAVATKRAIAARQTVGHMRELLPDAPYTTLIDIGAGEGAVLAELESRRFAKEMHALEISESGLRSIRERALATVRSIEPFDGYAIPARSERIAIGVAAHVLEHVEHERAFLRAVVECTDLCYIEVPLELTAGIERSIRTSGPYGHINFYTPQTFRNLLETSGVEVVAFRVFANSLEYEQYVGGRVVGSIKHFIRSSLLRLAPTLATRRMTYLAGAVCKDKRRQPELP